ncbi:hypothetical protein [Halalkalibacter oceani]
MELITECVCCGAAINWDVALFEEGDHGEPVCPECEECETND